MLLCHLPRDAHQSKMRNGAGGKCLTVETHEMLCASAARY